MSSALQDLAVRFYKQALEGETPSAEALLGILEDTGSLDDNMLIMTCLLASIHKELVLLNERTELTFETSLTREDL
jgi:hypothetical protein